MFIVRGLKQNLRVALLSIKQVKCKYWNREEI